MKKIINNQPIKIDVDFWADFTYGKVLQKITKSNIHDNLDKAPKEANVLIKKYREVFDNLHFVMKTVESDIKYCLIGELMNVDYSVLDNTLYIKIKDGYICFKGEFWSLKDEMPEEGIVFEDCSPIKNFYIYEKYLKMKGKNWFETVFAEINNACDDNDLKVKHELENILHFVPVKETHIDNNEILDLDLNMKYKLIPVYAGTRQTSKNQITVDLHKKFLAEEPEKLEYYNFSVYSQGQMESEYGTKVFGKEKLEIDRFKDIFDTLNGHSCKNMKGVKTNNIIFYECNGNIFRSADGSSERIIKSGKIYGVLNKDLLIYHNKILSQGIIKKTIYIMKDDMLDIIDVTFETKE